MITKQTLYNQLRISTSNALIVFLVFRFNTTSDSIQLRMSNQAAWITEAKAKPLKVDSADMWKPGPGEVLVKNSAWAVNPVDWIIQDMGLIIQKYPNVLGMDSAGEIHEVGEGVTHLKKGQRVMA